MSEGRAAPDDPADETVSPSRGLINRRRALTFGGAAIGLGGAAVGLGSMSAARRAAEGAGAATVSPRGGLHDYAFFVGVDQFGAVGDGRTDDFQACQAAIDAAHRRNAGVILPSGTFLITETLRLPSRMVIRGVGADSVIRQSTPGKPAIASQNWMRGNEYPDGHVHLHDFTVEGEPENPESHGIVLRDYYSRVERVTVRSCGGSGVKLTNRDSAGVPYGGPSLVENRISEVDVRRCRGTAIYLGEMDNNQLTDGYIHDCFIECADGATAGLFIGSSAGWKLRDLHVYGRLQGPAVDLANCYNTDVVGIYVEGYSGSAIRAQRIQQSLNLDQVNVRATSSGGHAVELASISSSVGTANVNIGSLNVAQDHEAETTALHIGSADLHVAVGSITTTGRHRTFVRSLAGEGVETVRLSTDLRVLGLVRDSTNERTLTYNGSPLALGDRVSWEGGGLQVIIIPLPGVSGRTVLPGHIIVGAVSGDGTKVAGYIADVLIAATDGSRTPERVVHVIAGSAPIGFSIPPEISWTRREAGGEALRIMFQADAPMAYGTVGVVFPHA